MVYCEFGIVGVGGIGLNVPDPIRPDKPNAINYNAIGEGVYGNVYRAKIDDADLVAAAPLWSGTKAQAEARWGIAI